MTEDCIKGRGRSQAADIRETSFKRCFDSGRLENFSVVVHRIVIITVLCKTPQGSDPWEDSGSLTRGHCR